MLEHVALNQTGFKIPGVAPDGRGVLIGKQGAALLPSIDHLIAFFRLLSEESSLDDILPALKIFQVETPLHAREFLVLLPAQSSYFLDRCARVTALCGGHIFTGSGKHYVKYRDRRSPLGYDTDTLHAEACDYVLYESAFTQGLSRVKELPFSHLVFQLSPRPLPGGARKDAAALFDLSSRLSAREVLWLTVQEGLGQKVLGYLWRNRIKCAAAVVKSDAGRPHPAPLFAPERGYLLLRISDLPERVLRLFCQVPGIEIFRPIGDNYVVELGYRHPLRLESCGSIFDKERFYLFCGRRDTCEALPAPPLLPGESLIQAEYHVSARAILADAAPARLHEREVMQKGPVQVPLRLSYSASRRLPVTAALVPWRRVRPFKQLIYALPPTLLKGYRAAPIEEGIFVVCPQGIDGLPIGDMYQEVAPSIFVPVGMDFLPRIGPEVLTEHLGGVSGRYIVFLAGASGAAGEAEKPLALPHGAFDALGRRSLAPLQVRSGARNDALPRPLPAAETTLVNEPLGPLPLWGFQAEELELIDHLVLPPEASEGKDQRDR